MFGENPIPMTGTRQLYRLSVDPFFNVRLEGEHICAINPTCHQGTVGTEQRLPGRRHGPVDLKWHVALVAVKQVVRQGSLHR